MSLFSIYLFRIHHIYFTHKYITHKYITHKYIIHIWSLINTSLIYTSLIYTSLIYTSLINTSLIHINLIHYLLFIFIKQTYSFQSDTSVLIWLLHTNIYSFSFYQNLNYYYGYIQIYSVQGHNILTLFCFSFLVLFIFSVWTGTIFNHIFSWDW